MTTLTPVGMDPASIRADFPILAQHVREDKPLVYLDNAATTQRPRHVIDALVSTYEHYYANVHRGIHWLSDQSTDLFEDARETVRKFIGAARLQEIIFTTGTTASINLVARSWGDTHLRSDDEIILSEMEHHSNLVPWQQLCDRVGCRIRTWPISDDGRLEMEPLLELLNERTRLLSVTAVSNVLGTINPIEQIVAAAHAAGVTVLVDAAQAVPHAPVNVQQWNADFVAFSGHKMMGPSGVGVLYGRESILDAMPPFLGGGSMIRRVRMHDFEPAELPAKFEAGTPPIVPAIGLKAAIEYVAAIGLERVAQHEHELTRAAHQGLLASGDVRIFGALVGTQGRNRQFRRGWHPRATTSPRSWTGKGSRFARDTTVPCHCTSGSRSTPAVVPAFISTTHEMKSTNWCRGWKSPAARFGARTAAGRRRAVERGHSPVGNDESGQKQEDHRHEPQQDGSHQPFHLPSGLKPIAIAGIQVIRAGAELHLAEVIRRILRFHDGPSLTG